MRMPLGLVLVTTLLLASAVHGQQLNADEAAAMLINSARRAFNEKNYPFAAARFKEFVEKHAGHKDAPSARYGWALALLEGTDKDFKTASEQLQQPANNAALPERPFAIYFLGVAQRGLGAQALALATAKPPEAVQHNNTARQHFEQAANQFATVVPLFAALKDLPTAANWADRARCDQAEMLLRLGKIKEAQTAVDPIVKQAKNNYRGLALYYHGYASFLLKDYNAAGRTLSMLAPFADPAYGVHARYLMARTHHLAEERPEALALYEALLRNFDEQKKAAQATLANPNAAKENPAERARLEALAKNPPPDHVARASFYLGVLLYEQQRYADAQARFATFAQQYPGSPLIPEAQLRLGFSLVQLKRFPEAIQTLQPLEQQLPAQADQVLLWWGRAQLGAADPGNAPAMQQARAAAADLLRRAADRANQLAAQDSDAKIRRAEILLELADTQQSAKQFKESAATYQQVVQENAQPERVEEAMQRQATAFHLAGLYKESDDACQRFIQKYPRSTLLPAIYFRMAENAYLVAVAAANNPNLPDRANSLKGLFGEAGKRYQTVIDKYPEFNHINIARFGLAVVHYRMGEYEKAAPVFQAIPADARTGELAIVPYYQADCVLRGVATDVSDALAAGRAQEQLNDAIKLLESFVSLPPNPSTADALVKLGYCHQQIAGLLAGPAERTRSLQAARQVYERVLQQFGNTPAFAVAVFERAKCMAQAGDPNGAINELNRFSADPLKNTPVAPVALARLASLLRSQSKAADAVKLLEQVRQQHEANLLKDPARVEHVPMLRYQHGLAVKDTGKLPEARAIFESIVKDFAARPEAVEATWRTGQCRREEALAKIDAALKSATKSGAKPEEITAANASLQDGLKSLRETSQYFEDQANQIKQKRAGSEGHARMLYEAAWCQRDLFNRDPKGSAASESKARALYQALIAAAPELPLALDARLELAELHDQRGEHDAAIKLLTEALSKDPSTEMVERLRLRLGACHLAKNDFTAAFATFDALAQNPKCALAPQARLRAAECLIRQGGDGPAKENWNKAVAYLTPFRDQGPLQNIPGISDHALLRLGHVYASLNQWDQSRQAMEILLQRFPQSQWVHDARYGIGWAWQNQKQHDNAINIYKQVTGGTAAEVAAKAQLQIGLCRFEQKRHQEAANALLVVPFTYDYPDLSALALCEASRCFQEMRQPDQAAKLLEKVVKDHPQSRWAQVAKQRLAEIR